MADVILKDEETINVTLQDEEVINVSLEETEPIDVKVEDINYIPGYIAEEEKRRANEEERISYYEDFKERAENGEFDGKDGAIQYTAGTNIEITEDNVINCKVEGGGGISDEKDPTVPDYVKEITEEDINNWNNKSEFSGDYNDLSNKPTIPTVPTNVSAFTNDAGYIKEIPSEYITESELDGKGYLKSIPEEYVTESELNEKGYITDLSNYYTKEETDTQISNSTLNVYNTVGRLEASVGNVEQLETESKVIVDAINEVKSSINEVNNPDLLFDTSNLIYFTPVAGTSYANYGGCYYYKVGTKVHVHLGLSELPSDLTTIFTFPVGYRPLSVIGGVALGNHTGAYAGYEVRTDGQIKVQSAYAYMLADIEFEAFV